ncbi:UDP-glucose 4-epimerase [Pelotomaculum schinkii]|uniref:UDP-glucose 4-epimerase n=1 Tax=Pelotomaculum schinkii TaxID=78350 RepID=A0A4Y7R6E2_9FIRM|nr:MULTISPECIES: SDR family oxidoreductase [Pelotomaculum]TEB04289.1 UDP-glucose 4-epimerase [Pelotomaculum schinkii]TEB17710.1 UDP-glucose 4-epimerase [Pelotomaculum sp. FP]
MKVVVTGGAGFIGSHIVDTLLESGMQVAVVDDLSTGRFENINPAVDFYHVKVEDAELGEVLARVKPDAVIHQAAQIDVQRSLQEPLADARINILGAINLLEACRRNRVGKVIYASSAAVYGRPAYLPVDEDHVIEPQSPYGASKHTVEHYLKIYSEIYGIKTTVLRYSNVCGPRQDASGEGGVVAVFADRFLNGKRPKIFGDGEQTRDFIYVGDVASANLAALFQGHGKILNVSTGTRISVNNLFKIMKELTNSPLEPEYCPPRPGDITHSYLANNRAREALNWAPRVSLEAGLRRTLEYYRVENK